MFGVLVFIIVLGVSRRTHEAAQRIFALLRGALKWFDCIRPILRFANLNRSRLS